MQITAVEPESLRRAVQTGKVTLGSVARGPLGNWGVPIRAPVIQDGKVVYVLSVILKTSPLEELAGSKRMDSHDSGCEWCDRRHGRISSDVACGC
jgi:hypothetical protein